MNTQAGIWLRVSGTGQNEANQHPDCKEHCTARGYDVARTYVVHGKSAYHGDQDPDWRKVVADVEAGLISVVVIWKVDRLDRRNILHAVPMVNAVLEAGGRIEFATQPYIDLATMPGRMAFGNMCEMAHEESKTKSDRVKASHKAIRANGALIGRPPWGYVSTGDTKYNHTIEPTALGRDWVPAIYARVLAGQSLATIAAWLDSEQVPAPTQAGRKTRGWGSHNVHDVVTCSTYAGRQHSADGTVVMRCEALVTMATFTAAGSALASRYHKRSDARSPARPVAMLTGIIKCFSCGGPMYRTGKFYRCSADPKFGGQRISKCANLVPIEAADRVVRYVLSHADEPVTEQVWQDGDDSAASLAEVTADIEEAQRAYNAGSLELAEFVATMTALDAQRRELAAREPVPGRYVSQATGKVYGDLVRGLDDSALRALVLGKLTVHTTSRMFPAVEVRQTADKVFSSKAA